MSLEIRDLSTDTMNLLFNDIQSRAQEISDKSGCDFQFKRIDATGSPALTDPRIRAVITGVAAELGLTHQAMQSGAGHDAQEMALLAPVGMIFIPSKDGISHSPKEYSSPEDMANGANVLLHSLLKLDSDFP